MYARVRSTVALALATALMWPSAAVGGDWPPPVEGSVVLPYGAAWVDGSGARCTHRGVDLAATEGDRVRCCAAGTVAFAGPVPGAAGGTVVAVTVQTVDGLRVTCMPLQSAAVGEGDAVEPGQVLGVLRGDGDGSSAAAHVHLSVRRGDVTLDPAGFLRSPPAPAAPPVIERPAVPAQPASVSGASGAPSAAVVSAPAIAGAAVSARASVSPVVPAPVAATSAASVAAVLRRAQVSIEAPAARAPLAAVRRFPDRPYLDLQAALAGIRGLDRAWRDAALRVLLAALAGALLAPVLRRRPLLRPAPPGLVVEPARALVRSPSRRSRA